MSRIEQEYSDPFVKKALEWFLSFLPVSEWERRKEAIEAYLDSLHEPKKSIKDVRGLDPVSIADDRIGWYLYLAETTLIAPEKYEPMQGSRILPIFNQMGKYFDQLLRINGLEERVKLLLTRNMDQADSVLFEIMTALLWVRNGYDQVEFIEEAPPDKRPDIKASSGNEEWFIECKRLAKSSGYSLREREKWLRMWRYLANFLVEEGYPFIFDITFHVELESLPDDFLQKELLGKIKFISPPCTMISNETWDVSVKVVDIEKANDHLEKFYVKDPSDQLAELVAGRRDPNRGFTYLVGGEMVQMGKGGGNNRYLDKLGFAAGTFWDCDAERAIEKKARDIRGRLSDAVNQLPTAEKSVVHVGLETLDGGVVEVLRNERIANTVFNFHALGKNLQCIYCHLFQSYSPPDEAWVIDETVRFFTGEKFAGYEPLEKPFMVLPDEESGRHGVHWDNESS